MEQVSGALLVVGAAWTVLAAIGVLKFDDVFARLHAGTKATTLGLILIVAGTALRLDRGEAGKLLLVVLLVFLTAPVGAHLIGRAVHRSPGSATVVIDTIDELRAAGEPPRAGRDE